MAAHSWSRRSVGVAVAQNPPVAVGVPAWLLRDLRAQLRGLLPGRLVDAGSGFGLGDRPEIASHQATDSGEPMSSSVLGGAQPVSSVGAQSKCLCASPNPRRISSWPQNSNAPY